MPEVTETKKKRWIREEIAEEIVELERASQGTPSQRQLAEELGIPRTTLQHWLKRKDSIDADPEVVAFFESPMGVAFLHRLILAAHFRHHSLHRISDRKLAALPTVHNYFVKRSDGTTAAERFFSAKPQDLFEWVLERVDLPGRPAQKRSQSQ